jgi:glycosyltransferase involved in cell wall biosynthesis
VLNMARPSICVVTHTFLPHVGGIERVVYEQGKRLLKKQFELLVLTSRNQTEKRYIFDGIRVRCYDSLNFGFRLGIPYSIPQVTSFKTFLESIISSDVVHAHGHPYLSSFVAAKIARKYSKPLVLTQHNTFIDYRSSWNAFERLNDLLVGKETLKEADKIIAVSDATKDYVVGLGADSEKVEVIHNGVDLDRFKPLAGAKQTIRKKLEILQNARVVVSVRRLVFKNGIDTLIESAKKVIEKDSRVVFLVIGKGPDFNEIKTQIDQLGISNNFRLTGFVSDVDLPLYYNAADFFVLPSKSGEGLPLVALEAMACGLPVIATNVGGIEEVMVKDYGRLVEADDPEAMAEAIIEFSCMDFTDLREGLRRIVEQKHGWDQNVTKLIKIYEELI